MLNELKVISIILFLFFSASEFQAQEFIASLDNSQIGDQDNLTVEFTFSSSDLNKLKNFRPPSFADFAVLSGPNQSTSMQIINGAMSASITYSYILRPKAIGKLSIGSATIEYDGRTFQTNQLTVTVVKGSSRPKKENDVSGISTEEIEQNLFIRAEVDKANVFEGEQVTVTYKLYTRLNISSPQITKLPNYQGFWAEEIDEIRNINFTVETYQGKQFRVAVLKRAALFPSQAGKLNITPFELKIPVTVRRPSRSNDIFDSFFGSTQTIDYQAKSNTLSINVKPLPKTNLPASFTGAVGDFNFEAELDNNILETNSTANLIIKLSGTGNIKLLSLPELKLPAGFEKYEPKLSEKIQRTGKLSGTKTIEYLLVPRVPGEFTIDSLEFSYFNPSNQSYLTKKAGPFKIKVNQGQGSITSSSSGVSKEDIEVLGQDIRFIKTTDNDLELIHNNEFFTFGFWLTLLFPPLLFITIFVIVNRSRKLTADVQYLRYQKAKKIAAKRLKIAKKALSENDSKVFYQEISSALFGFLEDKLKISKSEFTMEKALTNLRTKYIEESLIQRIENLVRECEFARFAPGTVESPEMNRIYSEAEDLIIETSNLFEKRG